MAFGYTKFYFWFLHRKHSSWNVAKRSKLVITILLYMWFYVHWVGSGVPHGVCAVLHNQFFTLFLLCTVRVMIVSVKSFQRQKWFMHAVTACLNSCICRGIDRRIWRREYETPISIFQFWKKKRLSIAQLLNAADARYNNIRIIYLILLAFNKVRKVRCW